MNARRTNPEAVGDGQAAAPGSWRELTAQCGEQRLGVAAEEAGWLLDRAEAYLRLRRGAVGHG